MASVDITQQPTVVEVQDDTSVVAFTESSVTVEVPTPAPVVEFTSAATLIPGTGLVGGGYMLGNVPIGLSPASIASLAKADTAAQPGSNLSQFVDDVGYATDAEVFALLGGLGGAFQPLNEQLTNIGALSTTAFGRSFLTLANEAAARTLIGVYSTSEVLSLLSAKANASHTHTTGDITGGISWSNLTGVPSTFPPGAHNHVKADVTDFAHTHVMADLTDYVAAGTWGSITGTLSAQTDLQAALDAKSATGHIHDDRYYTETEVDGLLTGLAVSGHTHTFASLTSKPTTLAGYGITDAADSAHTHTFASLTSKPTTLAGYGITDAAVSSHTHSYLSDAPSDGNQYARKNGAWDVVSAGGAYLPLVGGTLTGVVNVHLPSDIEYNRHFELTQIEGAAVRPIYLMFHQQNRWYNRIKAYSNGFHLVQGASDTLVDLYANGLALGSTGYPYIWNGSSGSVKISTAAGKYVEIGCQNSGFAHFYTDATSGFYFGQTVQIGTSLIDYGGKWSLTNAGQLALDAAGSHITMRDTDGVSADRGILEVNSGAVNIYTHDSSANQWFRAFAANIENGVVTVGGNMGATMYLWSANMVTVTNAATGYQSYQYSSGTLSHYLAFNATDYGFLNEVGSWSLRLDRSKNLWCSASITAAYNITLGSGYGIYLDGGNTVYIRDRAPNTYGSIAVAGSKNGWTGVYFLDAYQDNGLMVCNTDNQLGFYSESGGWKTYYNGTQWFVQGTTKAVPYCDWGGGGKMTASTVAPTGGSNGDIHFQYT